MALQPQDLTNIICGPFKFLHPTEKRDSSKRVIWECECICGAIEHGAKADIIKYVGHGLDCPGHPMKGKEKLIEGFTLSPDFKTTIEHAEIARNWELKRHPEQPVEIRESEAAPETPQELASDTTPEISEHALETTSEASKPTANKTNSTDGSDVLRDRLGLIGYRTECLTLTAPIEIPNGKIERVVFAKQISGDDRVFLHIQLVDANGKRGIVSSQKKVPSDTWAALGSALSEMKIGWRERDKRRKAA